MYFFILKKYIDIDIYISFFFFPSSLTSLVTGLRKIGGFFFFWNEEKEEKARIKSRSLKLRSFFFHMYVYIRCKIGPIKMSCLACFGRGFRVWGTGEFIYIYIFLVKNERQGWGREGCMFVNFCDTYNLCRSKCTDKKCEGGEGNFFFFGGFARSFMGVEQKLGPNCGVWRLEGSTCMYLLQLVTNTKPQG